MQTHGTSQQVWLVGPGGARGEGTVQVVRYDEAARTSRAVKRLAAYWVLALVSVALPILHFVLVPGLFLLGPLAAWLATRQAGTVLGGGGKCPGCGGTVEIEGGPETWPMAARCRPCREILTVERG
jgi:hypothetical protein